MSGAPSRYPLAARRQHWPPEAKDYFEERAGIVEAAESCTRAESEARAEALTRTWWSSGQT